jgi:hypothetical protein
LQLLFSIKRASSSLSSEDSSDEEDELNAAFVATNDKRQTVDAHLASA